MSSAEFLTEGHNEDPVIVRAWLLQNVLWTKWNSYPVFMLVFSCSVVNSQEQNTYAHVSILSFLV